jgi:hypothetical protein
MNVVEELAMNVMSKALPEGDVCLKRATGDGRASVLKGNRTGWAPGGPSCLMRRNFPDPGLLAWRNLGPRHGAKPS